MADIKLSTIAGGNGGLPLLAPDLTYPADRAVDTSTDKLITGLNPLGGFQTMLSLTGKFAIKLLRFENISGSESLFNVKLTVDGEVKWQAQAGTPSSTTQALLGVFDGSGTQETIGCNSSLLLEVQTAVDGGIDLRYNARPIL